MLSRRNFLRTLAYSSGTAALAPSALQALVRHDVRFEPDRFGESSGPIRLNSNESAYGPSQKTTLAMQAALRSANRYPSSETDALLARIAKLHGVSPDQVILGCGSTEILRAASTALLGPGKQLLRANPTFEAIERYAQAAGAEIVSLPLTPSYAHDLVGMLRHLGEKPSLVYICNPNNPTGSLTPRPDLENFIGKLPANAYILIDEAYHHYAGRSELYTSFLDRPVDDKRVIVCRTFSKIYGLAGLRLGYAVASSATIQRLRAHLTEQSVNNVVANAALTALDDADYLREIVKRNADDRVEFRNQAMVRMLKPIDSHTNFFMMDTHHPAQEVIQHFHQHQILIGRHFPAMDTWVRISLGTSAEMLQFWHVWDMLNYSQMHM